MNWFKRTAAATAPATDPLQLGAWGEDVAAEFLEKKDYTILERRYRHASVRGDLDLIARDNQCLVFVEVKTRRSKEIRVAEAAVHFGKRRAMIRLAQSQPFYGLKFEGRTFDCGSKIGFLTANVAYALARTDIAPAFRAEIKDLLGKP